MIKIKIWSKTDPMKFLYLLSFLTRLLFTKFWRWKMNNRKFNFLYENFIFYMKTWKLLLWWLITDEKLKICGWYLREKNLKKKLFKKLFLKLKFRRRLSITLTEKRGTMRNQFSFHPSNKIQKRFFFSNFNFPP